MPRLEHVIARNLIELREEKGVTQSEVAATMRANGYSWQTNRVTQIETLRRPVSLLEVVGLSYVFLVPVSRLLAGEDDIELPDGSKMALPAVRDALAGVGESRVWTPSPEEMEQHNVNRDDLRKIAKRVGRPVEDVDQAAYRVFGQSLFAERDQRAGDLGGVAAASAQTKRGHVTRQLVTELRDYFSRDESTS
jgi:transcriptional regulator with XRE-family HTH domain